MPARFFRKNILVLKESKASGLAGFHASVHCAYIDGCNWLNVRRARMHNNYRVRQNLNCLDDFCTLEDLTNSLSFDVEDAPIKSRASDVHISHKILAYS